MEAVRPPGDLRLFAIGRCAVSAQPIAPNEAASFASAFADRLVRVHTPLVSRVDALDWPALPPATRAALRASRARFDAFERRQPLTTTADVMALCREAEAILSELTRTLDGTVPVVTAPCGCLVLDDEWCRTCGGCLPRGDEWAGCCRCGVTVDATNGGRS
jgi:hypothetical protein